MPTPEEWVIRAERAEGVRETMESLDRHGRRLLRMKYEEGMRYAEIAAALGISVKSVEYQLASAREKFRQSYGSDNNG